MTETVQPQGRQPQKFRRFGSKGGKTQRFHHAVAKRLRAKVREARHFTANEKETQKKDRDHLQSLASGGGRIRLKPSAGMEKESAAQKYKELCLKQGWGNKDTL